MKISVIIPCHNAGPWVAQCLRSVAAQTHPPHEIIVINDNSTDDSVEQIRQSGVAVRLLETSFGNAAAARNAGIEVASGEWIAFQDADDLWYPEHLERAVRLLDGSDDVGFQANADQLWADKGLVKSLNPWPLHEPTSGLADNEFIEFFHDHMVFMTSAVVLRRDMLVRRGMFDPHFVRRHDMDMWLRVTKGCTWAYDPVASTVYRADTPGSVSRTSFASSDYWYLKMLLKNAEAYDCEAMRRLIYRGARSAMNSAMTDGSAEDLRRAWELAWPHLDGKLRLLYRAASVWPPAFGALNRRRRRLVMR